jgi:hypothetical protein
MLSEPLVGPKGSAEQARRDPIKPHERRPSAAIAYGSGAPRPMKVGTAASP